MSSVPAKFQKLEAFFNENKGAFDEDLRMQLYGLMKQGKEGDCKMPMPPSSNLILKAKWDAWTRNSGMSSEKAMMSFIQLIEKHQKSIPQQSSSTSPPKPRESTQARKSETPVSAQKSFTTEGTTQKRSSIEAPTSETAMNPNFQHGSVRKQGTLYKQRDVFKGWRPRHFVLQDHFLHYYLDHEDVAPRNSLNLTGCSVSLQKPAVVDGIEYYPFIITHPKSKTPYKLSSTVQYDTDQWFAAISEVLSGMGAEEEISSRGSGDTSTAVPTTLYVPSDASNIDSFDDAKLLQNLPDTFAAKVLSSVHAILGASGPESPGWESFGSWDNMFERNGVTAKRKPGSVICVKGEIEVNFNLYDVFNVIMDVTRQPELDPQQFEHKQNLFFNDNTFTEYIRFKAVWPTSARDFSSVMHWRMLLDGSVVIAGFSDNNPEVSMGGTPPVDGLVRAEMQLAGYVLKPTSTGTKIHYVVQTDLKGTLPASVVNLAATSQPMILATIKKVLVKDQAKPELKDKFKAPNAPVSYEDLKALWEKLKKPHMTAASVQQQQETRASDPALKEAAKARWSIPKKKDGVSVMNVTALMALFLPGLLYYAVDDHLRCIGFIVGALISYRYLILLHLGAPLRKPSVRDLQGQIPDGKIVINFPVSIGNLLIYLESKGENEELSITFTHITVKACGVVLAEMPTLNGHTVLQRFYKSRSLGVDVSMSQQISPKETILLKIEDADAKPVEYICDEVQNRVKTLRENDKENSTKSFKNRLFQMLPPVIRFELENFLTALGTRLGIAIPSLGVQGFPHGVCMVIASPNQEGEEGVDVALVPHAGHTCAPFSVSIGSLGIQPTIDHDRKVLGDPVLNFSVTMDSQAGSLADMRKFCTRLQHYLNEPELLDMWDKTMAAEKEEINKRAGTA